MIKSFHCQETQQIFNRQRSSKFPLAVQLTAYRKLLAIDAAHNLIDLSAPPANRLEKLKGSRVGQYSIRINDQYRICFEWQNGDAYHVEIVDYH